MGEGFQVLELARDAKKPFERQEPRAEPSNSVVGAKRRDIMTGGLGADLLIFQTVADFGGNTTSTADCFLDFGAAQGNRLHLSAIDADANTAASDEFTFIGTAAFSGVAGQLRYFQQAGDTFFAGDLNGDSSADFMVRVVGSHTLTAGNFVLQHASITNVLSGDWTLDAGAKLARSRSARTASARN